MSVFTFKTKEGNPVTIDTIKSLATTLGVSEEKEADIKDYATLLGVFHDACTELMDMTDYYAEVNLEKYLRINVNFPGKDENKLSG
jgi:amidase